jgi:hypothetical protein
MEQAAATKACIICSFGGARQLKFYHSPVTTGGWAFNECLHADFYNSIRHYCTGISYHKKNQPFYFPAHCFHYIRFMPGYGTCRFDKIY